MSDCRVFICSDGHRLAYNLWMPENGEVKAFIQIIHGMAEYGKRYEAFAKFLNKKGYAVFCGDLRGHGATAEEGEFGWFAEKDGWKTIASDSFELAHYVSTIYHAKQIFLLGHSLGSFLARTVMAQHPDFYSGVVIMGTGAGQGLVGKIGKLVCKLQIKKYGWKAPGELMNKLCFSAYNNKIDNPKTEFDWLSTDSKAVAKYVEDPLCGFMCSNSFFYDMITGVETANSKVLAESLPKDLPLLLVSGAQDPVGDYGKGINKVYNLYCNAGIVDVDMKLFENSRHEILNELNKKEVYDFLLSWFDKHI